MKSYLTNLSLQTWMVVTVPLVLIAYPLVTMVLPTVLRLIVPEVVRNVLYLM